MSNVNGVLEPGETVQISPFWTNDGNRAGVHGFCLQPLRSARADLCVRRRLRGLRHRRRRRDRRLRDRDRRLLPVDGHGGASRAALGHHLHGDPEHSRRSRRAGRSRRRELHGRADDASVLRVRRAALPPAGDGRLRRRAVLPGLGGHARADGGLPPEVRARLDLRAADVLGNLRRRGLPEPVRRLDRAASTTRPSREDAGIPAPVLPGQSRHPRPDGGVPAQDRARLLLRAAHLRGDLRRRALSRASSPNWIEQLFNEGITGGCGGGDYCPDAPVTRGQMAVFLLRTFAPLTPPLPTPTPPPVTPTATMTPLSPTPTPHGSCRRPRRSRRRSPRPRSRRP